MNVIYITLWLMVLLSIILLIGAIFAGISIDEDREINLF